MAMYPQLSPPPIDYGSYPQHHENRRKKLSHRGDGY
jgi:hypothetical protein